MSRDLARDASDFASAVAERWERMEGVSYGGGAAMHDILTLARLVERLAAALPEPAGEPVAMGKLCQRCGNLLTPVHACVPEPYDDTAEKLARAVEELRALLGPINNVEDQYDQAYADLYVAHNNFRAQHPKGGA